MAELMRDQPDYYDSSDFETMVEDLHADAIVAPGEGWNGQDAWSGSSEDAWALWFHKRPGLTAGVFSVGHRIRVEAWPAAEKIILGVTDDAAVMQCCVSLDTDGTLRIYKGDLSGTELAISAAGAMPLAAELTVGIDGVIDPITGSCAFWIGESDNVDDSWAAVLSAAGDTNGASGIEWRGAYLGLTPDIFQSHLYLRDGRSGEGGVVGLSPSYLVIVQFPNDDGVYTGWLPSSGTDKFALVDDPTPDGDSTYIYGRNLDLDNSYSFGFPTLPSTVGAIYGIDLISIVTYKDDGVSAGVKFNSTAIHDAATVATPIVKQSDISGVADVYQCARECFPINLKTSNPWSRANADAMEWGGIIKEL